MGDPEVTQSHAWVQGKDWTWLQGFATTRVSSTPIPLINASSPTRRHTPRSVYQVSVLLIKIKKYLWSIWKSSIRQVTMASAWHIYHSFSITWWRLSVLGKQGIINSISKFSTMPAIVLSPLLLPFISLTNLEGNQIHHYTNGLYFWLLKTWWWATFPRKKKQSISEACAELMSAVIATKYGRAEMLCQLEPGIKKETSVLRL